MDLRTRVVAFVASGHSRRGAARHFGVSGSFAVKLMHRMLSSGSCEPDRQGRPVGGGKLEAPASFLVDSVEAEPDVTMPELCDRLVEAHGVTAAPAELSRFFCERGYSYKKKPDGPGARTRRCA